MVVLAERWQNPLQRQQKKCGDLYFLLLHAATTLATVPRFGWPCGKLS